MPEGTTWDAPVPAGPTTTDTAGLGSLGSAINPFNTEQVQAFRSDAERAKQMASDGGFAINEDGGLLYTKACDTFLDGYEGISDRLHQLTNRPKVGSGPYADKLAGHWLNVMDGDHQSLLPNLIDIREGYRAFREAIQIARKNYNETEAAHDQYLGKMKPE